jgi:hypothetical protein
VILNASVACHFRSPERVNIDGDHGLATQVCPHSHEENQEEEEKIQERTVKTVTLKKKLRINHSFILKRRAGQFRG